jgi:hypothetical protein
MIRATPGSARLAALRAGGAPAHLVRPSHDRCTDAPDHLRRRFGPEGPLSYRACGPTLSLRRNATIGNNLGRRSRINGRPAVADDGSDATDPGPDHEPSNHGSFGQQARLRYGGAYRSRSFAPHRSPPESTGGDRHVRRVWRRRRSSPPAGRLARRPDQAERLGGVPGRSRVDACSRRGIPRSSRSAWRTLAAATRSGSRVIVFASQSMYDGSNAAT